jgi:hypothetical protein
MSNRDKGEVRSTPTITERRGDVMKIELYVPTSPKVPALRLKEGLIEEFGGLTAVTAIGYWKNGKGEIVREEVEVLTVFVDARETRKQVMLDLYELAEDYKRAGKQEAVMYVVDGQDYWV